MSEKINQLIAKELPINEMHPSAACKLACEAYIIQLYTGSNVTTKALLY